MNVLEKCGLCPLRDRDIPCIDQLTGHGHFCKRLAEKPELATGVVTLSEQRAGIAPEPPLPSLLTQARNFAAATARDVAHGHARLDPEATEARLAICRECPEYRPSDGRCSQCGCYLMNAKAERPHEHCPLGKWPAVSED